MLAPAMEDRKKTTRRNWNLLIALFRITALSNPYYSLLFIADLDLSEEILDFGIFRNVDEHPIEYQTPVRSQLGILKPDGVGVSRVGHAGLLRLRSALD